MIALESIVDQNGYEIFLFPCETLYLTPSRDPDEHDVLALDFLPRATDGSVITAMNCYAPFSGSIVYTGADHNCILQSDNPVHFADGTIAYARVLVAHSEIAPVLHTHYHQGDLFYQTGNYGQSYGEHLHMEIAQISSTSEQYWNSTGIGIYGAIHMWNGMYVNDTVLLRPKDYPWQIWDGPTPPIPTGLKEKKGFPWVLYARKFRHHR